MTRMQVGWIPDYVTDNVLADEEVDGFDLQIVGIHEATAEDRFTLNGGTRKHRFLPVEQGDIVTVSDDGRYVVGHERYYEPASPPDPERSDAEVLADLVALSDAGQVQIRMTHVDEGLPVYEVSWRKPGWSLPPHGPDIAAAHHSLGWPVAQVLEMAQPYIEPPDPRDAVVAAAAEWAEGWDATYDRAPSPVNPWRPVYDAVQAWKAAQ